MCMYAPSTALEAGEYIYNGPHLSFDSLSESCNLVTGDIS